jgi:hypothetical protein
MAEDRPTLELRIHGVNNTKPDAMLGSDPNDIEKTAGDVLGSFWRPTANGRAKAGIRDDVEREAYSWGEMARSSLGGNSSIGKVVGGLARVGWALLLPFGLVNVAYWTRKFDDGPETQDDCRPSSRETPWWKGEFGWTGRGAPLLRIAGLLITLLMAVTASVIALDLVAVQCFVGQTKVCTALPSFVDFLAGFGQARRLAVLSLVPVGLIAGLLVLSAVTRARYEQPEPKKPAGGPEVEAATAKQTWPMLAVEGFWSHRKITMVTARLHVAATATLVSMVTATHILFGFGGSCAAVNDAMNHGVKASTFREQCWAQVQASPRAWWELGVLLAGVAVSVLVLWSIVKRSDYAADVRPSAERAALSKNKQWADRGDADNRWSDWVPLIAAIILFCAQGAILATIDHTQEPTIRYLVGTSATPAILLTALLAIGLSALVWRLTIDTNFLHLPIVFVVSVVALSVYMALTDTSIERGIASGAIVALLIVLIYARARYVRKQKGQGDRTPNGDLAAKCQAWNGSAPGVFLLLAVLMAMLLSSAVATAAGNWLNGANTAASLADNTQPVRVEPVFCKYLCSTELQPPNLEVPLPYMWFGAMCLPILVTLIVGAVIAVGKSLRWSGIEPADGAREPGQDEERAAEGTGEPSPTAGLGTAAGKGTQVRASALQTRKIAAIAHRAERFVTLLVVSGTVGMIASIGVSAWGLRPTYKGNVDRAWYIDAQQLALDIGMLLLAGGGLLVIGLAVGGSMIGGARPLGLAWDLMCFLPRAGHPLAPPCYAERAVPELSERCRAWLSGDDSTTEKASGAEAHRVEERHVVLSAHSLGSVLAVAVLLSPRTGDADKSRIALLTYGSQLRAYFSRIFPELLGPSVLGIQPCDSSSLTTNDPWANEIRAHGEPITALPDKSLFRLDPKSVMRTVSGDAATPRWRNLWRRTDYLGFPIMGYPFNPIDQITSEVVNVDYLAEVQTHGNYPKTIEYGDAFAELLADLHVTRTSDPATESPTEQDDPDAP